MTIVDFKKKSLEKKNKEFQRVTNDLHGISIVDHFTKRKKKKRKKKRLLDSTIVIVRANYSIKNRWTNHV